MNALALTLATATTLQTLITPGPQLESSSLHFDLARRQSIDNNAVVCGDLQNKYPNVQAPICSGSFSVCSFSGGIQGCCNSGGSCNFYTRCLNHYATESCNGAGCLRCPSSAIFCYNYQFANGGDNQAARGFSCGGLAEVDGSTIYGVVGSMTGGVTVTAASTTSSSSSTRSSTSSNTSPSTGTSSTSSTPSQTSLGTNSGSNETSAPGTTGAPSAVRSGLGAGAIAGIVVGVLVLVAIGVLIFLCLRRKGDRRHPMASGKAHTVPTGRSKPQMTDRRPVFLQQNE